MKYCKKCLYPDTKPKLIFNSDGICSACENSIEKESIDWDIRREELKKILNSYKHDDGRLYDCIIPISGGKDSTYQTYIIKEEFGLNPLVVNFHPRDFTEIGRKNIEVLKNIGVDCIEFSANPLVYKKLEKFITTLRCGKWAIDRVPLCNQ